MVLLVNIDVAVPSSSSGAADLFAGCPERAVLRGRCHLRSEASHSPSAAQSLEMAWKTRPVPRLPTATIAGVLSHTMTIAVSSNIAHTSCTGYGSRRNHRILLLVFGD